MDQPIFVMPDGLPILGNLLVAGYIHDLVVFDPIKMHRVPYAVESLIHRFYATDHLMVSECIESGDESTLMFGGDFEWRFHNRSDIDQFLNCRNGGKMTTVKFMMNGYLFHLELIVNDEGQCSLLLIARSFPPDIQSLAISLSVECEEIEFSAKTSGSISEFNAFTVTSSMDFGAFNQMTDWEWTFEVQIALHSTRSKNGDIVHVQDQWMNEVESIAESIWERHQSLDGYVKESAINALKEKLNAKGTVVDRISREVMTKIETKHHLKDTEIRFLNVGGYTIPLVLSGNEVNIRFLNVGGYTIPLVSPLDTSTADGGTGNITNFPNASSTENYLSEEED